MKNYRTTKLMYWSALKWEGYNYNFSVAPYSFLKKRCEELGINANDAIKYPNHPVFF